MYASGRCDRQVVLPVTVAVAATESSGERQVGHTESVQASGSGRAQVAQCVTALYYARFSSILAAVPMRTSTDQGLQRRVVPGPIAMMALGSAIGRKGSVGETARIDDPCAIVSKPIVEPPLAWRAFVPQRSAPNGFRVRGVPSSMAVTLDTRCAGAVLAEYGAIYDPRAASERLVAESD
jgi:hypothetical protein